MYVCMYVPCFEFDGPHELAYESIWFFRLTEKTGCSRRLRNSLDKNSFFSG